MKAVTFVRLIVAFAILVVLTAGMAIVVKNSGSPENDAPAGFIH